MEGSKRIEFHFHPFNWDSHEHTIEKDDGGNRRKYMRGISSGIQQDLHGEKMTEKCIKSFHEQANSGDILLYEGKHGVNFVDDIGKLSKSEITPEGNWYTEYQLYDEADGFSASSVTLEKVEKLWKQVNGLPPYTKPRQQGFSIEGDIPDGGIVQMDMSGRRVIDDVALDGVLIVTRPAYKDSIATAVFKALGELFPEVAAKTHNGFKERLSERVRQGEIKENFYQQKYLIEDELDKVVHEILTIGGEVSREKLQILFQEYSDLMINLILQNEEFFMQDMTVMNSLDVYQDSRRLRGFQQLESALKSLVLMKGEENNGNEN